MCVDLSCKYVDNNQQIPMHQKMYIWRFTKIRDFPNHPFLDGIFHELNHPFWGTPMTMETPYIPIINHNITINQPHYPIIKHPALGYPHFRLQQLLHLQRPRLRFPRCRYRRRCLQCPRRGQGILP